MDMLLELLIVSGFAVAPVVGAALAGLTSERAARREAMRRHPAGGGR